MSEVSTIYHPQRQIFTSSAALHTPTPESRPTADTVRDGPTSGSPSQRPSRRPSQQGRGFQIRQGSFKLNALRLPKSVARFVIMQVTLSCGCALLGILSIAFRCWMAYLCIPVVVGALELLIGIIGYTAIKRPRKKSLVNIYFAGCLFGSLAGLGLVVYSIIAAANEEEERCMLLPNVVAECNAVRGGRFAIELTTAIVGVSEIIVTQVMFMVMCYGSCAREQSEEQGARTRLRNPHPNPAAGIAGNLELPSYDEHHHYPTSPFYEGSFFTTVSSSALDPPSYTNIGLVNDEMPGCITPLAAALGSAFIPAEPPPPYTLFASGLQSVPLTSRNVSGNGLARHQVLTRTALPGSVVAVDSPANISRSAGPTTEQSIVSTAGGPRSSERRVASFTAATSQASLERQRGWRDRTIHQSLRLSSEQSAHTDWSARSAHQRHFSADHPVLTAHNDTQGEDQSIVPPELYRDQIRRSGHRYNLSDFALQGRNGRNRQRGHDDVDASQSVMVERTRENSNAPSVPASSLQETDAVAIPDGQADARRQTRPPPYEGRHNVVRSHSSVSARGSDGFSSDDSAAGERQASDGAMGTVTFDSERLPTTESMEYFFEDLPQSSTLPSRSELPVNVDTGRPEPDDAVYETIGSPQASPSQDQRALRDVRNDYDVGTSFRGTSAAEYGSAELLRVQETANAFRSRERDYFWRRAIEHNNGENRNRGRSGSRSWDEGAGQRIGLPDVVGGRHSTRERPRRNVDRDGENASENRTLPSRQPPPYGRRVPAYAPPPYRPRKRVGPSSAGQSSSLPNYARRKHLASPPPPYQGHQQRTEDVDPSDSAISAQERESSVVPQRTFPKVVRELSELSDSVVSARSNRQHNHYETRGVRNTSPLRHVNETRRPRDDQRCQNSVRTFHSSLPRNVTHSAAVVSASSLAISPPSSLRSSPPSSSREYPITTVSSSSAITTQSPREQTLLSSSQPAAVPQRRAQSHAIRSPPASHSVLSYATNSRNSTNSSGDRQYPRRPRPVVPTRSNPASQSRQSVSKPLNSSRQSPSSPPLVDDLSTRPPALLPLHPLSLPGAPTQQQCTPKGNQPEGMSQTENKPAAEIHPFRTVRNTPVKPQKAFVATKALASALQKGQLNDLLEEYEETII